MTNSKVTSYGTKVGYHSPIKAMIHMLNPIPPLSLKRLAYRGADCIALQRPQTCKVLWNEVIL